MAGTALRRIGTAATVLVGLVLIILLGIYGISGSKMRRTYVIKAETLNLKSDSGTMTPTVAPRASVVRTFDA